MSSLIQKGLVQKSGGIRSSESEMGLTYQLTEAGEALASELNAEAQSIEQGKAKPPPQQKRSASAIAQGAGAGSAANSVPKPESEADS
jgi:DNA-binding MarR family transcriptional regulator